MEFGIRLAELKMQEPLRAARYYKFEMCSTNAGILARILKGSGGERVRAFTLNFSGGKYSLEPVFFLINSKLRICRWISAAIVGAITASRI